MRTFFDKNSDFIQMTSVQLASLIELFDSVGDIAFFVKDCNCRYVAVNQSLLDRYGLGCKEEAIGRRASEVFEGELGRIPTRQDESVIRTGRPLVDHLEVQWRVPHELTWCVTTKLPLREEGVTIGLIGFSRDVHAPIDNDKVPAGFAEAIQSFQDFLSESVSPAWLAEKSGLTPQKLAKITKHTFGITPTQLIARIRMSAACQLLLDNRKSISEVAIECGFYDHSAFTRAFKLETGVTPSAFRKQVKS